MGLLGLSPSFLRPPTALPASRTSISLLDTEVASHPLQSTSCRRQPSFGFPSFHQYSTSPDLLRPAPSRCSFYARFNSSLPLPPLQHLPSPRTTLLKSPSLRSPVGLFLLCAGHLFPANCCALSLLPADPNLECTPYYYAPSGQFVHNFPPIWQPATLLANDSAGQAMWSKIAGSIPNIAPKGQLNGSTINVTYDNANDPDCCEFYPFCPSPTVW